MRIRTYPARHSSRLHPGVPLSLSRVHLPAAGRSRAREPHVPKPQISIQNAILAAELGYERVLFWSKASNWHFVSKADLYLAVLNRACARLVAAVGAGDYTSDSVDALLGAAALDPDGFRLLFEHAAREPEFRQQIDAFREQMTAAAYEQLAKEIPSPSWARWAAVLTPMVVVEAITAWLDAGQPDRDDAADRIRQIIAGVVQAAQPRERPESWRQSSPSGLHQK